MKTNAAIMRKPGYNSMKISDKRPGYDHDVEVVIMRICLNDLISKIRCIGYVLRLCDWSCIKVM